MRVPFLSWVRSAASPRLHHAQKTDDHARRSTTSAPVPQPGATVSGDFFHNGAMVHAICRVERTQASHLRLRIVAELGKVSFRGLKSGTHGHIELGTQVLPLRVTHVNLPFVDVLIFPHHARPAHRQLLRVPATFRVRLRRKGARGLWISGQGVDLSAGGCHFTLTPPTVPHTGEAYDLEMLIPLPDGNEERPVLATEVRWVRPTSRNIYVGMEIHLTQRKTLATATAQFQHALSRHPQDYVLT